jgi:MFS family permease
MTTDTRSPTSPSAVGLASRARSSRWAPLPVVLVATFMVVLDFFIVNVALPSIQGGLHASSSSIEWIVAGYGLTSAVLLLPAAQLGDRLGRRRVFSYGRAVHAQLRGLRHRRRCGGAVDITVAELSIEAFFPADASTAQALRERSAA